MDGEPDSHAQAKSRGCLARLHHSVTHQDDINCAIAFRVLLSMVFFTVCCYLCAVGEYITGLRNPSAHWKEGDRPIKLQPDLGYEVFDSLAGSSMIAGMIGIDTIFVVLLALSLSIYAMFHPQRSILFRRHVFLWGCGLALRSVTMVVTSPPDPNPECLGVKATFSGAPAYVPGHISCGDLMYSGHTVFFTLAALTFTTHSRWLILKLWGWAVALGGMWSLIAIRIHYTSDVLVSLYVIAGMWYLYHMFIHPQNTAFHARCKCLYACIFWLNEWMPPPKAVGEREYLISHRPPSTKNTAAAGDVDGDAV